MAFDCALGYGESQTGSSSVPIASLIHAIERLKYPSQGFRRDAWATVGDSDANQGVCCFQANRDVSICRCVP